MPSRWWVHVLSVVAISAVGCGSSEAERPIARPRATAAVSTAAAEATTTPPDAGASAPAVASASPIASSQPDPSGSAALATPPGSAADAGTAPAAATPLGPFDPHALPKTKLALIMAVEAALRAADPEALGKVWLDDSLFGKLCPGVPKTEHADLKAEALKRRRRGADTFAECLELADWSGAKRLALNYGSRTRRVDTVCSYRYLRHEDSELYYAIGDTVHKVKIYRAVTFDGWHAVGRRIRCSKKEPGSAPKMKRQVKHIGTHCPGVPWPRLSQIRGNCPSL